VGNEARATKRNRAADQSAPSAQAEPCGMRVDKCSTRSFRMRLRFDRFWRLDSQSRVERSEVDSPLPRSLNASNFGECGLPQPSAVICGIIIHEAGWACGPPRVFVKELHSIFCRCGWRWAPSVSFCVTKLCSTTLDRHHHTFSISIKIIGSN
jgi:hypothetical protein